MKIWFQLPIWLRIRNLKSIFGQRKPWRKLSESAEKLPGECDEAARNGYDLRSDFGRCCRCRLRLRYGWGWIFLIFNLTSNKNFLLRWAMSLALGSAIWGSHCLPLSRCTTFWVRISIHLLARVTYDAACLDTTSTWSELHHVACHKLTTPSESFNLIQKIMGKEIFWDSSFLFKKFIKYS